MPSSHPAAVIQGMQGQVNTQGDSRDQMIVYMETKVRDGQITPQIGEWLKGLSAEVGHPLSMPPVGTNCDAVFPRVRALFGEA